MTQRGRRRHRRSRGSPGGKILLGLGVIGALLGLGAGSVGLWVLNVAASAPSIDELKPIQRGKVTTFYASDGSRLGNVQDDVIRDPVGIGKIPKELQLATIAIEDASFYEHGGVDYQAIVRAFWENLEAGEIRQGGSTITQQLVRNLYLEDPEDTIERKIREAKLASELEDAHSKDWILGQYLNTASYGTNDGRTAVGVEAASQFYFSKHVKDLNLGESALLAGLPQAPSEYNPFINPDGARERRNQVLKALFNERYISSGEYEQTRDQGLGLNRGYRYQTIREPYFFNYVQQELIDRYGVNKVRQGGLKVYTTIDPGKQKAARQAIAARYGPSAGPSAAMVSVDPDNGHILAMASSESYEEEKFNLAAQGRRQPGSSFKPFVLTTAIEQGINPYTTYYDSRSPVTLSDLSGLPWEVSNAEGGSAGGPMSIASATTGSVNVVYAQLDLDVGPENVKQTAEDLGVTSPLLGVPAEGIGGLDIGVSPLEMANAYGTFANGGIRHEPLAITKVEFPDGEVDEPETDESKHVISDGIAYEVTKLLKTVVTSGTATAANFGCPAAGKTGTTDEQTDAWFVGYTPRLSTAVWVGYPNARISLGSSAFGGTMAAPVWHDYMLAAHGSYCDDFPPPESSVSYSSYFTSQYTVSPEVEEEEEEVTTTTKEKEKKNGGGGAYAPGVDQKPAPAPDGGGGGGGAGGGGGGSGGGGTGDGPGGGPGGGGGPPGYDDGAGAEEPPDASGGAGS